MYPLLAMGGSAALSGIVIFNHKKPLNVLGKNSTVPLTLAEVASKIIESVRSVFQVFEKDNKFLGAVKFGEKYLDPISDWSVFLYLGKRVHDWSIGEDWKTRNEGRWVWKKDILPIFYYSFLTGNALLSFTAFLDKIKFIHIGAYAKGASKAADGFMASACVCDFIANCKVLLAGPKKLLEMKKKRDDWSREKTAEERAKEIQAKISCRSNECKKRKKFHEILSAGTDLKPVCELQKQRWKLRMTNHLIACTKAMLSIIYDITYIAAVILGVILPVCLGMPIAGSYFAVNAVASSLEFIVYVIDKAWNPHIIPPLAPR